MGGCESEEEEQLVYLSSLGCKEDRPNERGWSFSGDNISVDPGINKQKMTEKSETINRLKKHIVKLQ